MKKSIVALLFLLPAIMFAKATIQFKNTTVNFGEVASGKIVDIIYEFENKGAETLLIRNVIPSCGCTTAVLDKKEYRPGEKGAIAIKFNTSNYNGKVIKTITVTSNDADAPETRLTLSGTVIIKDVAKAEIKPDQISFGSVSMDKVYVRKFNLSNSGNADLRIIETSCGPELSLEFKTNNLAPKKTTDVSVNFSPFEKGTFNGMVKIRTNDSSNPYVFVRVEAQVN
jgi:hypothetical protein